MSGDICHVLAYQFQLAIGEVPPSEDRVSQQGIFITLVRLIIGLSLDLGGGLMCQMWLDYLIMEIKNMDFGYKMPRKSFFSYLYGATCTQRRRLKVPYEETVYVQLPVISFNMFAPHAHPE